MSHSSVQRPKRIFVGREKELALLRSSLNDAIQGAGRMEMITGEPGIGKTQLIQELSAYAVDLNVTILFGRCFNEDGVPSFWPWIKAFRPYFQNTPVEKIRAAIGPHGHLISAVFPDVKSMVPEVKPVDKEQFDSESLRFELFDAISTFLTNISQADPLMIVLEDLHWIDEASIKLLIFLLRDIERGHIFLVGTSREVELPNSHPLSSGLLQMAREHSFTRHMLLGFTEKEIGSFIEAGLSRSSSPSVIKSLFDLTDGNPFFIDQVVRYLDQHQDQSIDSLRAHIPSRIREAIGESLTHLSADCSYVLPAATILSTEFTALELAGILTELDEAHVTSSIEQATAARVFEEVPDRPGFYRFVHELIRAKLADEMDRTRWRTLHAKAGEMLEAGSLTGMGAPSAEVAEHYAKAGFLVNPETTARAFLHAGNQSLSSFGYEDALSFFRRGIAVLQGRPMDAMLADLKVGESISLLHLSKSQQAIMGLQQAFDYFLQQGDAAKAAEIALSPPLLSEWDRAVMLPLWQSAISHLPPDTVDVAGLLARVGRVYSFQGNDSAGQESLREAIEIARKLSDHNLELFIIEQCIMVDWQYGRYDEYLEKSEQLLELAQASGNRSMELIAVRHIVHIFDHMGETGRQQQHLEMMVRIAEVIGDRFSLMQVKGVQRQVAQARGDWEQAREHSDLLLTTRRDKPLFLLFRIQLEYTSGHFDDGERFLQALIEDVHRSEMGRTMADPCLVAAIGVVTETTGSDQYADLAKETAKRVLASNHTPGHEAMTRHGLADICIAVGDAEGARTHYQWYDEHGLHGSSELMGSLARTFGELDLAVSHLEKAYGLYPHNPPRHAEICFELGVALLERGGEVTRVRTLLDEGLEIATELGMPPLAKKIELSLATINKKKAEIAHAPNGLTPRELEVLSLVASGRTNQEIADVLFISPKTVHNHTTNIFAKIGVSNRTEAASFANKRGLD